jgi:integrase
MPMPSLQIRELSRPENRFIAQSFSGLPSSQPPEQTPVTTSPFAQLADEFLSLYQPPSRAKTTCRLMRQTIRELSEDPLLAIVADLSPATLWRWIRRYPDRSAMTTAVHLRNLRCLCNYAVGRGFLATSPFAYDSKLRKAAHAKKGQRRRHHSLVEVGCVLGYLRDRSTLSWEDGRLFALASLAAYTGVRALEAQFAEVKDFDLESGFFHVEPKPNHPLKTESSERDVPIPPPLATILGEWLPRARSTWAFPGVKRRGPWSGGMCGSRPVDRLQAAGLAVGVRGFTFLSLRHSFITHGSGPWGLGSIQIQQIAGHSLEDTQRHYLGRDRTNLRDAVATISFPMPAPLPVSRAR